jgi:hypothetical protein
MKIGILLPERLAVCIIHQSIDSSTETINRLVSFADRSKINFVRRIGNAEV